MNKGFYILNDKGKTAWNGGENINWEHISCWGNKKALSKVEF